MSEFTDRQKNIYRVKMSVTVQRMVQCGDGSWIPLPGDGEVTVYSASVREFDNDPSAALDLYQALKER